MLDTPDSLGLFGECRIQDRFIDPPTDNISFWRFRTFGPKFSPQVDVVPKTFVGSSNRLWKIRVDLWVLAAPNSRAAISLSFTLSSFRARPEMEKH